MLLTKNWSIKTKILLPAVGGVSVVGIVLFIYFLYTIYGIQTKNLDNSTKQTVSFLANALEYPAVSGNADDANSLLDWLMKQPEIKSIHVDTEDGQLIFRDKKEDYPSKYLITYQEDIVTNPTTDLLSPSDEFYSDAQNDSARVVGQVTVVISNEQLFDGFYNELFLAGMFFLFVFVFVLTMSLLSINSTNRSFHRIKQAIQQYQDGDMNARIDLESTTDIGKIALQFNNMAQAIQEKDSGLREATSLQNRFISTMSHDLPSPLGVIISNLELTLEREDVPASGKMNLKYSMMASKQLLKLIDDIIGINRLTKNADKLVLSQFDLVDLVKQAITTFSYDAESKRLHLSCDTSGISELWLEGDSSKITRLLNNLISNAVKFTEKGSVHLLLKTEPIDAKSISVSIEVRDTGIGIHEDNISDIFKPFKRIDDAYNTSVPGSGLGLSIVSEYVNLMGGEISVQSKQSLGSAFVVSLPLKLSKRKPLLELKESNIVNICQTKSDKCVLFVDDNEQYRNIIRQVLGDYELTVCSNGMEAIKTFRENKFCLVILDCHMPLMDGFAVALQIRRIEKERNLTKTPIIALTANAVPETKRLAELSGMDDYMTKPFTKGEIMTRIEHWLGQNDTNKMQ